MGAPEIKEFRMDCSLHSFSLLFSESNGRTRDCGQPLPHLRPGGEEQLPQPESFSWIPIRSTTRDQQVLSRQLPISPKVFHMLRVNRSHTIEEAGQEMAGRGIKNAVFVQCYNDCPEEIEWVFKQASALSTPRAVKYI